MKKKKNKIADAVNFVRKMPKFWKAFAIYTLCLVVLCAVFLIYVGSVVSEYEAAQPARKVEMVINDIQAAAKGGTFYNKYNISSAFSKYCGVSSENEFINSYTEYLKNAKEFSFKRVVGSGEGLSEVYSLVADGKKFANVTVSGKNERAKLFFFSMADWDVSSVEFTAFNTTEYNVYIPDGMTCKINGITVDDAIDDSIKKIGNIGACKIKNVPSDCEIKYYKADGTEIESVLKKGSTVKPLIHSYIIPLDSAMQIRADGVTLSGEKTEDGKIKYTVNAMTVEISDIFGNSVICDGVPVPYCYTVELPEGFKLSVNGKEIEKKSSAENPDAEELAKYISDVKLPNIDTYSVVVCVDKLELEITDNLGELSKHEIVYSESPDFSVLNASGTAVPDEIRAEIDPMQFAVDWSKFTTNDIELSQILKYFKAGTSIYEDARKWRYGLDHTFTSAHRAPEFSNEKESNFIKYNDNCFSVEVSLSKSMHLTRTGNTVVDDMNRLVYFVKENGKWFVAVSHDIGGTSK